MTATRNCSVVAESDDKVVVEGKHYFAPEAVKKELLLPSNTKTMCSWKGEATYHTLFVDGGANPDAAQINGRVAFWKGVMVEG